jgi:hypothetical protein
MCSMGFFLDVVFSFAWQSLSLGCHILSFVVGCANVLLCMTKNDYE